MDVPAPLRYTTPLEPGSPKPVPVTEDVAVHDEPFHAQIAYVAVPPPVQTPVEEASVKRYGAFVAGLEGGDAKVARVKPPPEPVAFVHVPGLPAVVQYQLFCPGVASI